MIYLLNATQTLSSIYILLKVTLRHEVLELHASSSLRKDDTSILLLNLEVSEV